MTYAQGSLWLQCVGYAVLALACSESNGAVDTNEGRCSPGGGLGTCDAPVEIGACSRGTVRASTLDAEHFLAPTTCGAPSSTARERVYHYLAPDVGRLTLDLTSESRPDFDSVLYVRTPGCEDGVELACNDDYAGSPLSRLSMDVAGGQELIIVVDGFASSEASDFEMDLRFVADPPASGEGADSCSSPKLLQLAERGDRVVARGAGTTATATDTLRCFQVVGESRRFMGADHTYVLDAPALDELRVTLETEEGFDAGLHLRIDCAEASVAVACEGRQGPGLPETLVYRDLPEGRYYIVVDGQDDRQAGAYELYVEGILPAD